MIDKPEYILCAAWIRSVPRDKVTSYKHPSIQEKYGKYDDVYKIELGRRHGDILRRFKGELDMSSGGGFYTSYGRYVDRDEALKIALSQGQTSRDKLSGGSTSNWLYSEDLY